MEEFSEYWAHELRIEHFGGETILMRRLQIKKKAAEFEQFEGKKTQYSGTLKQNE